MVDTSPVDAIFFQPSDDICEDLFVLPYVLGYLGMPDPVCWAVRSDLNRLVGIVKLARCLRVDEILNHLGSVLEIAPESWRAMKTGMLRKKIRSQLRYISIPYVLPSILTRGIYVTFGSHQSECEPFFTEIDHYCALLTCAYCVARSIHVVSLIPILESPGTLVKGTPQHASFVEGAGDRHPSVEMQWQCHAVCEMRIGSA